MSDHVLVATRKGLFTIDRTTSGWEVTHAAFIGDNLTNVLHDPRDGSCYVALHHGHFGDKLHRSTDKGESWSECGVPTYPDQPEKEDVPEGCPPPPPWNLDLLWTVVPGGSDQPGVLWAGTIPGGLFRSEDSGASWKLIRSLWNMPERYHWFGGGYDKPGIHSIVVDPADSQHLAVGVSCGGVWVTRNGGESWSVQADGMRAEYMPPERTFDPLIQDPHIIVQCASKPECKWVQHHNGIFRTTDDCASWQEINDVQPSVFGFAVAVHPSDPETAWFVPAIKDEQRIPVGGRVVVTRTRDGGKSFEQLTKGLPQTHAYDLVFRHALDIDASGDRLVMGSTTGGLWISEDQGDSWQLVSAHLPPIHATRFVL